MEDSVQIVFSGLDSGAFAADAHGLIDQRLQMHFDTTRSCIKERQVTKRPTEAEWVLRPLTLYSGIRCSFMPKPTRVEMTLSIGQLAAAADVNVQTVRYYERRGFFPAPRRTAAGYRQYSADAVARLRFIKHAQALGFSLREIGELLALRVRHGAACDSIARKARRKLAVVEQRIRDLERLKATLGQLAEACRARRPTDDCPILEALDEAPVDSH